MYGIKAPSKITADILMFFSEKISLIISYEWSAWQTIHTKCKKKIVKVPRKCRNHEALSSHGTKRMRHEEQTMTKTNVTYETIDCKERRTATEEIALEQSVGKGSRAILSPNTRKQKNKKENRTTMGPTRLIFSD